VCFGK